MKRHLLVCLFLTLSGVTFAQDKKNPDGKKTPEDLIEALRSKDPALRIAARKSLVQAGAEAIPALSKAIDDESLWVKKIAIHCLGRLGSKAGGVAAKLVPLLEHEDGAVVVYAQTALGNMGEKAVTALLPLLKSKDPQIRRTAVITIGENRSRAGEAVPALIRALVDVEIGVRASAATALAKLGKLAFSAAPALLEAITDKSFEVQLPASEAIYFLGEKSLPSFAKGLAHENSTVRFCSAKVLGYYGQKSAFAVPELIKCLKDENGYVRRFSCAALGKIQSKPDVVIPALIRYQCAISWGQQDNVREALLKYGKAIVPHVIKKLEETGDEFSSRLLKNLEDLGPESKEALPLLTKWLGESKASLACLEVLAAIGKPSEVAIPQILPQLVIKSSRFRVTALQCLAKIGDDALALGMPIFCRQLYDLDDLNIEMAAEALGKLGKRGKPAYSYLRVISFTHKNKYVRKKAKAAMEKIAKAVQGSREN